MTRTSEEPLEVRLRTTFAGAREGVGDLTGVAEGGFARAGRLRRRRALAAAASASVVAALSVVAVAVGTGAWGPATALTPAGSTSSASTRDFSDLVAGPGKFAYRFPDVLPDPLPAGVQNLALAPEGTVTAAVPGATGATARTTLPVRSGPVVSDEADLAGVAGFCRWEDLADRRQPVAGRSWQLQLAAAPGGYGAHLGLAGFTTGTGAEALRDLRSGSLACTTGSHPVESSWQGPGQESFLFSETSTTADVTRTTVLAVSRVGDVLVAASGSSSRADDARAAATALASAAGRELLREEFPPAGGLPLGGSAIPPNDASSLGAPEDLPLVPPDEFAFGDVLPTEEQLGRGLSFHGDPLTGRNIPAVVGAQACDLTGQPEAQAASAAAPKPVAGTNQTAWSGDGEGLDPTVDLTVTGYAEGMGPEAFARLQQDRGECVWMPAQARDRWSGQQTSDTWLSHSTYPGDVRYVAARLVGDTIVSVVVSGLPAEQAEAEAIRVNGVFAAKVAASGLPAAKGR